MHSVLEFDSHVERLGGSGLLRGRVALALTAVDAAISAQMILADSGLLPPAETGAPLPFAPPPLEDVLQAPLPLAAAPTLAAAVAVVTRPAQLYPYVLRSVRAGLRQFAALNADAAETERRLTVLLVLPRPAQPMYGRNIFLFTVREV